MIIQHYYLKNGLEVVLKPNHFAKMVAAQCWVHAGSLNERDHEKGIAHVLEHMLFKGTSKREVGVISSTVEACGGDMNAYTTFDRTVYYLTMSSQHGELAVELLSDAIINSSFDTQELEREKEVIVEEIRRGNDSPSSRVGHKMFERIFVGTEAARPIIGYEESVRGMSRNDLVDFHRRWYVPRNMAFVLVGDFHIEDAKKWVEKYFGELQDKPIPLFESLAIDKHTGPTVDLLRGDYQQPRLEMSWQIPGEDHPDTISLDLAAFALGSGETSRFVRTLRDEHGVVIDAHAGVYTPQFGGMFEISLQSNQENYLKSIELASFELAKMILCEPIKEIELERARANLRASRVYSDETVSGQARVLGYGLTTKHKLMFDDVVASLVEKTPQSLVQEALRRSLKLDDVAIVGLIHHDWSITEDQIKQAFCKGLADARKLELSTSSNPTTKVSETKLNPPEIINLKNGIKLVYRQNPDAKLFSAVAVTRGGLRFESESKAGLFNACAGMLGMATLQRSYEDLSDFVESRGAMIEGFSGKDSVGVKIHCLDEHQNEFQPLLAQMIYAAVFPEQQWTSVQRDIVEDLKTQDDSPSGMAIRQFQQLIYGDHPYRYHLQGLEKNVASWSADALQKQWNDWAHNQAWVFSIVGSKPLDDVRIMIEEYTASWKFKAKEIDESNIKKKLPDHNKPLNKKLKKEREQSHIVMGFSGLDWYDQDRYALDVLSAVLGGSGGRLFTNLRDKESLAYSVSPIVSYGVHGGVVGAYIACSPPKVSKAKQAMEAEFRSLCDQQIDKAELQRAIEYIVGNHEADMQRADAQALTMGLMELYQVGADDFLKYPQAIRKVLVEDVQNVARRLFKFSSLISVEVGLD